MLRASPSTSASCKAFRRTQWTAARSSMYRPRSKRELTAIFARAISRADKTWSSPRPTKPRVVPTVSGGVIAWEATIGGVSVVRVSYRGTVRTITGPFDHAGEPRAAADGVVFTIWMSADPKGDTDVDLYLPETGELLTIATGPNQQRFADISATRIAFTDFTEDPDGHYDGDSNDLADIAVYDRSTRETTPRPLPNKQAFPMLLAGNQLAYLHWDWVEVHPEPKLAAYHLRVGSLAPGAPADHEIARVAAQVPPYVRPAVHEATLEWVDSPGGKFQLWRAAADGSSAPTRGRRREGRRALRASADQGVHGARDALLVRFARRARRGGALARLARSSCARLSMRPRSHA